MGAGGGGTAVPMGAGAGASGAGASGAEPGTGASVGAAVAAADMIGLGTKFSFFLLQRGAERRCGGRKGKRTDVRWVRGHQRTSTCRVLGKRESLTFLDENKT